MILKTLTLSMATALMLGGAAFAQDVNTSDRPVVHDQMRTDSIDRNNGSILDDDAAMAPFYTDKSMTKLRTGEEFTQAYNAMSGEDKERVWAECKNTKSPRAAICDSIRELQYQ